MTGLAFTLCELQQTAGAAPEWVHLLPTGRIEGRDGRRWTLSDARAVVDAFTAGKIDLPVDYEHQNDAKTAERSGPVPAAGWIRELRLADTGISGVSQKRLRVGARGRRGRAS